MSKNKYVISTTAATGKRTRHYFDSRDKAREFCRVYLLPLTRIAKN